MKQFNSTTPVKGNGHSAGEPETGPHLVPHMPFAAAGRAVLAFHFGRVMENEASTLRGEDPEALHDMRVATRRLRAALRHFQPAFGKAKLKPLVEDVGWLADLLGRIRDIDVFIEWLKKYIETVPAEQRPYVHRILQDRAAARDRERAALVAGLRSERYREYKCRFEKFLHEPEARNAVKPLMGLAVAKIEEGMSRVHQKGKKANARDLARLHLLRIECKRLRYTAEIFNSLFPDHLEQFTNRVKDVQDSLGTVHDSHIYAQFLKQMLRLLSVDQNMSEVLEQSIEKLDQEQKQAYARFERAFRKFDSGKYRRRTETRLRRTKREAEL
ncbi:MAG: CHAD domain-containing protein [Acidobacteriota bacterium]